MTHLMRLDGAWAEFGGGTQEQFRYLYDRLAFFEEDAEHKQSFQSGQWDGFRRLMDWNGRFPAGLMQRAERLIRENPLFANEELEILGRDCPFQADPEAVGFGLRDYQDAGIRAMLASDTYGFGIGEIATGGGKTRMAIATIKALLSVKKDAHALFIVTTQDIREQSVRQINELLGKGWASELVESARMDLSTPILITTAAMLAPPPTKTPRMEKGESRAEFKARKERFEKIKLERTTRWLMYNRELFPRVDVLEVDEAHHAGSESWFEVCMSCSNAYWRHGWTGTAFREDGSDMLLEAACGPVRYTKTADELVKEGYLVRPSIYMVRTPLQPIFGASYREVYDMGVVMNEGRNLIIKRLAQLCVEQRRHTLLLVKEEKHGNLISEMLEGKYPFVTGKMAKGKRSRMMDAFRDKKFPLMIATTLADEGLDIPAVDTLITAGGGKSDIKAVQRPGRIMRLAEGKKDAIVFDFEDSHNRMLAQHSRERAEAYSRQRYPVYSWEAPVQLPQHLRPGYQPAYTWT